MRICTVRSFLHVCIHDGVSRLQELDMRQVFLVLSYVKTLEKIILCDLSSHFPMTKASFVCSVSCALSLVCVVSCMCFLILVSFLVCFVSFVFRFQYVLSPVCFVSFVFCLECALHHVMTGPLAKIAKWDILSSLALLQNASRRKT